MSVLPSSATNCALSGSSTPAFVRRASMSGTYVAKSHSAGGASAEQASAVVAAAILS